MSEKAFTSTHVRDDQAPIAQVTRTTTDTLHYLHADPLGTPRLATDAARSTVWRYDGNAFGDTLPTGSITVNLRFPGQYYDTETKLHYNWHRYYDPRIGRYVTSDPIGLEGGLNSYAYVGGNPLAASDPEGLLIVSVKYSDSNYGSVTMVWNNSWYPKFYASHTRGDNGTEIGSGIYRYSYGQHPLGQIEGVPSYPALNITTLSGSRVLPGTRLDGRGNVVSGVNFHYGNRPGNQYSGSLGCHVVPKSNWQKFIENFGKGDQGLYLYWRLSDSLKSLKSAISNISPK